MNPWHFILGAYVVTAIVVIVEVIAVRARHRAALAAAQLSRSAAGDDRR